MSTNTITEQSNFRHIWIRRCVAAHGHHIEGDTESAEWNTTDFELI